jgi:hypothetical protein
MAIRVLLLLLGLFHIANGIWMLADPMGWYAAVPGVTASGPFNHHFICDIGFAFIACGAGMAAGFLPGLRNAVFAIAGSVWPALHGLFHIYGWIANGFPQAADVRISDVVAVVAVSSLGLVAALVNGRREGAL